MWIEMHSLIFADWFVEKKKITDMRWREKKKAEKETPEPYTKTPLDLEMLQIWGWWNWKKGADAFIVLLDVRVKEG